jgi:hypothetical protein
VVAAPFSVHPVSDAANEPLDGREAAKTQEQADDAAEMPQVRRGILKRFMAGLRALFGRSRKHK